MNLGLPAVESAAVGAGGGAEGIAASGEASDAATGGGVFGEGSGVGAAGAASPDASAGELGEAAGWSGMQCATTPLIRSDFGISKSSDHSESLPVNLYQIFANIERIS